MIRLSEELANASKQGHPVSRWAADVKRLEGRLELCRKYAERKDLSEPSRLRMIVGVVNETFGVKPAGK